jgi:hypothetical protein
LLHAELVELLILSSHCLDGLVERHLAQRERVPAVGTLGGDAANLTAIGRRP